MSTIYVDNVNGVNSISPSTDLQEAANTLVSESSSTLASINASITVANTYVGRSFSGTVGNVAVFSLNAASELTTISYVPPTYANSALVVITNMGQTGSLTTENEQGSRGGGAGATAIMFAKLSDKTDRTIEIVYSGAFNDTQVSVNGVPQFTMTNSTHEVYEDATETILPIYGGEGSVGETSKTVSSTRILGSGGKGGDSFWGSGAHGADGFTNFVSTFKSISPARPIGAGGAGLADEGIGATLSTAPGANGIVIIWSLR